MEDTFCEPMGFFFLVSPSLLRTHRFRFSVGRLETNSIVMSEEEVQYVKLVSAEGHEFLLDRSIAIAYSKTMSLMLEGSFREAQDNVIRFPDMAGYILERLVKYLHYKAQYSNSTSRIPEFVSPPNPIQSTRSGVASS
jgi:elongin-C